MATSDAPLKELGTLIVIDDEQVAGAMKAVLAGIFADQYQLRCSVKSSLHQVRTAVTVYDFDLVLLFINSVAPNADGSNRFEATAELINELKTRTECVVIGLVTFQPPGFTTTLEQAGVDGIVELPYTFEGLKHTITTALECRAQGVVAQKQREERARQREKMRPRVVLVDDSGQVLQIVGSVVWDCWPQATLVACTDSQKAWEELQRTPPDLFITDLIHGGVQGLQLLVRLAEQEVTYPIVVLSGNLPEMEVEARTAAGTKLKVSYWPKPINCAEFAEGLKALL
jgi:DNA-binding NtrC family response regulator